jgi:hypothetical protein
MFVAARPRAARSPRQCACLGLVRGYRAAAKNKESGTVDYNAVPPASQWKDVLKFGREKRVLISNPATAAAFAKAILSGSGGDRPNLPKTFIEAFPGPGLLTRKLLEYPPTQVKKIIVLEDSASCWPYLTVTLISDPLYRPITQCMLGTSGARPKSGARQEVRFSLVYISRHARRGYSRRHPHTSLG